LLQRAGVCSERLAHTSQFLQKGWVNIRVNVHIEATFRGPAEKSIDPPRRNLLTKNDKTKESPESFLSRLPDFICIFRKED